MTSFSVPTLRGLRTFTTDIPKVYSFQRTKDQPLAKEK